MNDSISVAAQSVLREIPLASLTFSTTGAQGERRRRFDKAALAELAESIRSAGVLQPIVVRPFRDEHVSGPPFEVVAGERRVMAARQAGLETIPAAVRELTDQQVLELQLIENLQREGLHELIEAEGYEALMKSYGYSVDDLIAKVGKSRGYVYARLKLTALCPEARNAFHAGDLTPSTALLVARIPLAALQEKALKDITQERFDGPMSTRSAADHIQRNYMLSLAKAPFPTGDDTLVPGAVACGRCPKNTASQPELFGDVEGASAGVCTDPGCFNAKRRTAAARTAEQARARGQKVIDGTDAKKIVRYGIHSLEGGYVKLDDKCWDDPKHRSYRQLLGKAFKPTLLQVPKEHVDGDEAPIIEVAQRSDIAPLLKQAGVARPSTRESSNPQSEAEKKARLEKRFRSELYAAVRDKLPRKLTRPELEAVAISFFWDIWHERRKRVLALWGWNTSHVERKDISAKVKALSDADVALFLQDCLYSADLTVSTYSSEKPEQLLAAAKSAGIDAGKVRAELAAKAKGNAKPSRPAPSRKKK